MPRKGKSAQRHVPTPTPTSGPTTRLPAFLEVEPYRFVYIDDASRDQLQAEAVRVEADSDDLVHELRALASRRR